MPTTSGMKGAGYYDQHSSAQRAAIEAHLPLLEGELDDLALPQGTRPATLVDFGSSEGGNSVPTMARLVARLRGRTAQPILVVFSDLPSNDWNHLSANLQAAGPSARAGAATGVVDELGAAAQRQVWSACVAGSMYEQLLPPRCVDLATTFNALSWLGSLPTAPLPNYVLPMGPGRPRAGVSVSAAEREPFARQAAEDVRRFLRARAAELVPGGKLLLQTFGRGAEARACDGLYDVFSDALLDLVEAGRFARALYEKLIFPVYFRSVDELTAPLAEPGLATRFRLEAAETREVRVPFNERLRASRNVAAYAEEYTGFLRAFSEPIVRAQVLPGAEASSLIDEIYARVRARLTADPQGYAFRYVSIAALLTRQT